MGAHIHGKIWYVVPWPLSPPYLELIRPLATHLFSPVVDTCFVKTRLLNLTLTTKVIKVVHFNP